jgi:hypothetical protein
MRIRFARRTVVERTGSDTCVNVCKYGVRGHTYLWLPYLRGAHTAVFGIFWKIFFRTFQRCMCVRPFDSYETLRFSFPPWRRVCACFFTHCIALDAR